MIFDRFASLLVLTCAVMVPIANSAGEPPDNANCSDVFAYLIFIFAAAIDIEFDYEIWGSQFEGCVGPSAQNGSFFNNQCTNPDTYYLKFTLQATAGDTISIIACIFVTNVQLIRRELYPELLECH